MQQRVSYLLRLFHKLIKEERERRKRMDNTKKVTSKVAYLSKALLVAYGITMIFLLILAFCIYKGDFSTRFVQIGISMTYIFSTFIAGMIMGKCVEQKKFFWGMLVGFFYFLLLFFISMICNQGIFMQTGSTVMVFCMCTLGGMLGGMLS